MERRPCVPVTDHPRARIALYAIIGRAWKRSPSLHEATTPVGGALTRRAAGVSLALTPRSILAVSDRLRRTIKWSARVDLLRAEIAGDGSFLADR